ncbi:MAG: gliding motility-associated ABC transporter substrate-binding protein GldG [Chloroflexia bacterium]|nr:gliding motility-associated ABC transporter substrate-binding protein GldG [Chloroflexia bacterium]
MDKKKLKKQNIIQLLAVLIIVVLINYIASFIILRLDLTSEGRYTLSDQTKKLLSNLDEQLYVKVYLEGDDLPVGFKRMRRALNDLLEEFNYYGKSDVSFRFINPTDIEDKKAKFGLWKELSEKGLKPIESQDVSEEGNTSQKLVFPGVVVVYKGKDMGLNLLKTDPQYLPDSEENINNSVQSMEYELTNAIRKLSQEKKPEIAFIEGQGELNEMEVMDITTLLSEYYEVKRGAINETPGILDQFEAVIIAKPIQKFSENDKLVLDQYIMNGGKALWLLDGASINMDSLSQSPVTAAMPLDLNLDDQLFRYGVRLNPGLLQDAQCAPIGLTRQNTQGEPIIDLLPWPYFSLVLSDNSHAINKYMNVLRMEFPSTLDTVASSSKVKKTILLSSSDYSKFEYAPAQVSFSNIKRKIDKADFKNKKLPVAVLLEGEFESNFKNRLLQKLIIPKEKIIEQSKPTKMVVVADGDIAANKISSRGEVYPVGFDPLIQNPNRAPIIFKGNKEFIINAMNYLCDDEGLMSVRLREITMRLLDKDKVKTGKTLWKTINTLIPVLLIILFGIVAYFIRKRKYTKAW